MHEMLWSDDELRSFLTRLRDGSGLFSEPAIDEVDRARFIDQARIRVVPEVQRRILAAVGARTSEAGVAAVAFEVVESLVWGKRHTWLMVSTNPWALLTDFVATEVQQAYRSVIATPQERKLLKGIAEASSRTELTQGDEDDQS